MISNSPEIGGQSGKTSYMRYLALWGVSWALIILLTQLPVVCQMASAAAAGRVVYGCLQIPPRHPMPFISALSGFAVGRICIAIPFALFFALVSLGIHELFLWLWRRFGSSSKGRIGKQLVENGVLAGLVETLLLGIPIAILVYETVDVTLVDADCAYALTNRSFLHIQTDGVVISYFVACVIAAVWAGRGRSSRSKGEAPEQLLGGVE